MTEYFSDRETGPQPRVKEEIDQSLWNGIRALIDTRINDGSLAHGFPRPCGDGNAVIGTDKRALRAQARAEIPNLDERTSEHLPEWPVTTNSLSSTLAILDYIEFIARHVAEPSHGDYHNFFKHHHLELDREAGIKKFVEDINRLFSRNGLAYELTEDGAIQRTVPAPLVALVNRSHFHTGDNQLDHLLKVSIEKHLSPESDSRQDALEKLWDAFERMKTVGQGKDKKVRANALIKRACSDNGSHFLSVVRKEFEVMTKVGNDMRIRHSEIGKEPVGENGEQDYLFMRLFSLIYLMMKKTGRLTTSRRVKP